jgi:hypothetical protein
VDRCCSEPVETIPEVTHESVCLTESLRAPRGLASPKHLEPSFEMLVIALDVLLHGLSREVLDLRQYLALTQH